MWFDAGFADDQYMLVHCWPVLKTQPRLVTSKKTTKAGDAPNAIFALSLSSSILSSLPSAKSFSLMSPDSAYSTLLSSQSASYWLTLSPFLPPGSALHSCSVAEWLIVSLQNRAVGSCAKMERKLHFHGTDHPFTPSSLTFRCLTFLG